MQTLRGRLYGDVAFRREGLTVGGKTVRWGDVLFVLRDGGRRLTAPHAVRLANGEVWAADIVGLSAKQLALHSPLFGERKVAQKHVAELVFAPLRPRERIVKPATLYRQKGEPVPGSLIWIDAERIALDSPLGVLKLAREGVTRYVFEAPNDGAPPAGETELHLLDGSVLRGKVEPADGRLKVTHAVLGSADVPAAMVRAVIRRPRGVVYLAEQRFASVEAEPLVVKAKLPERVAQPPPAVAGTKHPLWLRGVRVWPKAKLSWRLPRSGTAVFRTALGLDEGSRGGARVRILAAGRALFDEKLSPGSEWKHVSLGLPAGNELTVEVEFDGPVRFPCSVLLGDPHVAAVP